MTIPGAVELIARLTSQYKETAIIGAGTVLNKETTRKCVEAGAKLTSARFLTRKLFPSAIKINVEIYLEHISSFISNNKKENSP